MCRKFFVFFFFVLCTSGLKTSQQLYVPFNKAFIAVTSYIKSIGTTLLEEQRAFSHMRVLFPGLITDEIDGLSYAQLKKYAVARIKESGLSLVAAVGAAIMLSSFFQQTAKTESRFRSKKFMVAGLCLAALYGSQLHQRYELKDKTLMNRDMINRLVVLGSVSTAVTFFANLFYDYYKGTAVGDKAYKHYCEWSLEVAFFTMVAAATSFTLDSYSF